MSMSTIHAGFGELDALDLDDETYGIQEALVNAECAAQEARVDAAEVFARIARRPGTVEGLDAHDLAGIFLAFPDTAID